MKYNDTEKFAVLSRYKFGIESGKMSPLVKFDDYIQMKKRIDKEIVGLKTVNGYEIKAQSNHFVERLFGSIYERRAGVKLEDIKECLINGEIKDFRHSKEGESCTYILNGVCKVSFNITTGNLIQVSPD